MSMEFSQISVPLGGGLQRSVHRWKVKPPAALEVQNIHFRAGEALTKRDQYLDVIPVGRYMVSEILIPQDRAMLLLNAHGAHRIADKLVHSQYAGYHVPTEIKSHSLLMFRGAVAAPQIAYNNGLFGVVYTEADPETGRAAVLLIVNEKFEIIDGPIRFPDLACYTRIEALGDGFALFGTPVPRRPGSGMVELYCAEWRMGITLGPTQLMLVELGRDLTTIRKRIIVYDTCPGPSDHSCVAVAAHSTGDRPGEIAPVVQIIEPGIVIRDRFQLWPGWFQEGQGSAYSIGYSVAVWYEEASDTLMVYSEVGELGTGDVTQRHLYTTSLDLSVPVTQIDMPEISGLYPVFYGDEEPRRARLNDVIIQCTGDSARSITHTVPDGFDRPLHIRPQPRGGVAHCFFQEHTKEEGDLVGGPSSVYTASFWSVPFGTYGVTVSPLHVGRLPLWRQARFPAGRATGEEGTGYGVVGQSVLVGNSVYIAQLVANAAYLPPPLWTEDDATVVGGLPNFWNSATDYVQYRVGGAGVNEGTEQLVITEIRLDSPNYSYVDYYGTALIAAGGLSGFDGVENLPVALEAPRNVRTEVETRVVGEAPFWPPAGIDNAYILQQHQLALRSGTKIELKGVLVYIDRNGIKYRSPSFDIPPIEHMYSHGELLYFFPKFWFDLPFSVSSAALGGNRLVLEVYTSDIMDIKDDASEAEFRLMFRGGVQWDVNKKLAYVDATTFFAPRREDQSGWSAWEFNPTPLYTELGEIPPAIPPASNVLTQAGNFLFLAPSEDPFTIWHSKPLDARMGPEFSPLLTLTAPPESGGIVSLAGESDRLLLLCKKGVWELFVGGESPDIYGNGAFPPYRKLWGGEGCIGHHGTVSGLFGTFFLSDSGPKIVGRDGSVSDVSRDLGADLSQVIRAVYHSEDQEIWLFTPEEAFVFDLVSGQWSTATLKTKAAAYRDGVMFRLHPDTMMLMSASKKERGDETVYAKYVSPWLSLSGPMDYKRLQEVSVLIDLPRGEATGKEGGIRVSIAYDYKDVEVDVREWHLLDMLDLDLPVQLKVRPTKQKADAYRITVEEFETGGFWDENDGWQPGTSDLEWSLVDISLNVAAKGGLVKLQAEAKK